MEYLKAAMKKKENLEEATNQHSELFEKAKFAGNLSEEDKKNIIKRNITASLLQLCISSNIIISKYTAAFEGTKNAKDKNTSKIVKPAYAANHQINQINNVTSNNQQQDYQEEAKVVQVPFSDYVQPSLNLSSNLKKLNESELSIFPGGNNILSSDQFTNMDFHWKVVSSSSSGFSSNLNSVAIDRDWDEGFTLITSTNKSKCLVISDVFLDNERIYTFSCCFNKPLNGGKGIAIGVFEEEENNKGEKNRKRKVGDCYFDSCSGLGVSKIIKGSLLNSDSNSTALTKIEFEVCIARQIFRVSDSAKDNINECSSKVAFKNVIGNNYYYQLGIEFDCPVENEIEILISQAKVYELKVEEQEKDNNNNAQLFDFK